MKVFPRSGKFPFTFNDLFGSCCASKFLALNEGRLERPPSYKVKRKEPTGGKKSMVVSNALWKLAVLIFLKK